MFLAARVSEGDGKGREARERRGEALGIREGNLLLARGNQKIGGAHGFAFVFARDANCECAGATGKFEGVDGALGDARVREDEDSVALTERGRIEDKFERLPDANIGATGGEVTKQIFCDLGCVERAADADNPKTVLFRGSTRGLRNQINTFANHAPHERRLLVNRVVETKRMSGACFGHFVLFRFGRADYADCFARIFYWNRSDT